jgi:exonuclease VII large subunit
MIIERLSERLDVFSERLESVSVEAVLKRGFAWIKDEHDQTVYTAAAAKKKTAVTIRFADGEISFNNSKTDKCPSETTKKSKKSEKTQASLFDF